MHINSAWELTKQSMLADGLMQGAPSRLDASEKKGLHALDRPNEVQDRRHGVDQVPVPRLDL